MNRRLLKTANGSGLYEVTHPEIGSWLEWQRLPPRDTTDPALRLSWEATPKAPGLPGGLYGNRDAHAERDRRRKADRVLADFGLLPQRW